MNRDACIHFEPVGLCEKCNAHEVVAGLIDGVIITNDRRELIAALKSGRKVEWQAREKMRLMSDCGVGAGWDALADAPTLFWVGVNGEPLREPPR